VGAWRGGWRAEIEGKSQAPEPQRAARIPTGGRWSSDPWVKRPGGCGPAMTERMARDSGWCPGVCASTRWTVRRPAVTVPRGGGRRGGVWGVRRGMCRRSWREPRHQYAIGVASALGGAARIGGFAQRCHAPRETSSSPRPARQVAGSGPAVTERVGGRSVSAFLGRSPCTCTHWGGGLGRAASTGGFAQRCHAPRETSSIPHLHALGVALVARGGLADSRNDAMHPENRRPARTCTGWGWPWSRGVDWRIRATMPCTPRNVVRPAPVRAGGGLGRAARSGGFAQQCHAPRGTSSTRTCTRWGWPWSRGAVWRIRATMPCTPRNVVQPAPVRAGGGLGRAARTGGFVQRCHAPRGTSSNPRLPEVDGRLEARP
jgi:hypothetical protein